MRSTLSSRRAFLRTVGSTAAASAVVGRVGAVRSPTGHLVITYDDSPETDYTVAYPIHREENVPGCVAAIAGRIDAGSDDSLDPGQLREMAADGWEVLSHTMNHLHLVDATVVRDVQPGDERIYVDSYMITYDPIDNDVVVSDGEKRAVVQELGGSRDERGKYITLAEPIGVAFDAEDGVTVRMAPSDLRRQVAGAKERLEGFGFDVSAMVAPYGMYSERTLDLVQETYEALANAHHAVEYHPSERSGLNGPDDVDPFDLRRMQFAEGYMSKSALRTYLDDLAESGALGILGSHTGYDSFSPGRVRDAIRMAKDRGIEIVTLREGLDRYLDRDASAAPGAGKTTETAASSGETPTVSADMATSTAATTRDEAETSVTRTTGEPPTTDGEGADGTDWGDSDRLWPLVGIWGLASGVATYLSRRD